MRGQVGLLNLETPVELAQGAYEHLRIFAGYAGWDAGQLQQELEFGMWYVVPALASDPSTPSPASCGAGYCAAKAATSACSPRGRPVWSSTESWVEFASPTRIRCYVK